MIFLEVCDFLGELLLQGSELLEALDDHRVILYVILDDSDFVIFLLDIKFVVYLVNDQLIIQKVLVEKILIWRIVNQIPQVLLLQIMLSKENREHLLLAELSRPDQRDSPWATTSLLNVISLLHASIYHHLALF